VPVDGELLVPVVDEDVVVVRGRRGRGVLVAVLVDDLEHAAGQRGEDRHAEPLLAEAAQRRILPAVAVVRLAAAAPVEELWPGVEIDEVRHYEVAPEVARLGVEREREGRAGRAGKGTRLRPAGREGGAEVLSPPHDGRATRDRRAGRVAAATH
jgi:hypothetical protein